MQDNWGGSPIVPPEPQHSKHSALVTAPARTCLDTQVSYSPKSQRSLGRTEKEHEEMLIRVLCHRVRPHFQR